MSHAPIFLFGSERSGSNLLRTLLGNHPMVEAPVAPHFFDSFLPFVRHYGDLHVDTNMLALLTDMHELVQHPFHDWALTASPRDILETYRPTGFYAATDALWRARAAQVGKSTFMSKDNHLFSFAFEIKAQWPDARFIYLYRDPRDHCASWSAMPLHLKSVFDMVSKWEREQRRCLFLNDTHDFKLHFMSYEDLIVDTPQVMARALAYCGLPVDEACFQTDPVRVKEAGRIMAWDNLAKPIMRENKRKYRKVYNDDQVRLIETIAAPHMKRLGYERETTTDWTPPSFHALRLKFERRAMDRKGKELKDDELRILYEKQAVLKAIKNKVIARSGKSFV